MNIMTNLLCFYDFVIVLLFELDLATECRHSVASCRFCSCLHVYAGSRCHLRGKHIWSYSTSFPHQFFLPTKSELNIKAVMHEEERQFPIKTRTLQMSAVKHKTVNKSFNLIRSGRDTYPRFSQRVVM